MVSPTGDKVVPVQTPNVTNAAWVRVDNPNMAQQVDVNPPVDIYVRYEQFQPQPADAGYVVRAGVNYGYRTSNWLGWHRYRDPVNQGYVPDTYPGFAPMWVRLVGAGSQTIDTNWIRE